MRSVQAGALALLAGLLAAPAGAYDVCSSEEHRAADAAFQRAQAAEAAGDAARALALARDGNVTFCADGRSVQALVSRVTLRLGKDAEAAGNSARAFDYFVSGGHLAEARRIALSRLRAAPADRSLAESMLAFMRSNDLADGVALILDNVRAQAERLLAEEAKAFTVRTPHRELLQSALEWLRLAGDEHPASVRKRASERGDQLAALDYPYALQQAIAYYEMADRADGEAAVRAKARMLAEQKEGSDGWAEAVELFQIAGDAGRAEALEQKRRAQAERSEETRKQKFEAEQEDLEKELGL